MKYKRAGTAGNQTPKEFEPIDPGKSASALRKKRYKLWTPFSMAHCLPHQPPWQTEPMRILVNFMHRDGWSLHCVAADCLAPDCKTLVSQWVTVRTDETLLRLLKASGATPVQLEEVARDMERWGRGSTFIDCNDTGRRLLRIK
jgi:hypothetical protein